MSKQATFTEMLNGTAEDYAIIGRETSEYARSLPDRILEHLSILKGDTGGFAVDRFTHCLQTATRAYRDKADEEMVVAALLHDIGDELAPLNHSEYAAAIIKPYVSEKTHWIIQKHGEFQMYYYAHHLGKNKNQRNKYKDHKYYKDAVNFCEKWDQASFDPNFKSMTLKDFAPMVKRIFTRKPYSLL